MNFIADLLDLRPLERMSGFLPEHAECQETASQHRLNSKGLRNGEYRRHWLRVESLTSRQKID